MSELLTSIAAGFGLGRVPVVSGLAAMGLGFALAWWIAARPLAIQVAVAAVLTAVALPICHAACLAATESDPGWIIADEFLTLPAAVIGWAAAHRHWAVPLATVLTALLDRLKPFPADWAETLPGATGIVLDDVVAAGYVLMMGSAMTLLQHLSGKR